jgi:hypothetical protein
MDPSGLVAPLSSLFNTLGISSAMPLVASTVVPTTPDVTFFAVSLTSQPRFNTINQTQLNIRIPSGVEETKYYHIAQCARRTFSTAA